MAFFSLTADPKKLLERCRNGDRRAWDELVELYQNLVYSIARRMRLNEEDAADVFQQTFLALYRSLDRIENAQTLPKWLAVTASREALKIKRINSRTVQEREEEGLGLEEIVAAEECSAEQISIKAVEHELVRQAVEKIGGRCKDLLSLLYFVEDSSYQEISERLGVPVGAIGPTRARCLEKLRKLLEESDFL